VELTGKALTSVTVIVDMIICFLCKLPKIWAGKARCYRDGSVTLLFWPKCELVDACLILDNQGLIEGISGQEY